MRIGLVREVKSDSRARSRARRPLAASLFCRELRGRGARPSPERDTIMTDDLKLRHDRSGELRTSLRRHAADVRRGHGLAHALDGAGAAARRSALRDRATPDHLHAFHSGREAGTGRRHLAALLRKLAVHDVERMGAEMVDPSPHLQGLNRWRRSSTRPSTRPGASRISTAAFESARSTR